MSQFMDLDLSLTDLKVRDGVVPDCKFEIVRTRSNVSSSTLPLLLWNEHSNNPYNFIAYHGIGYPELWTPKNNHHYHHSCIVTCTNWISLIWYSVVGRSQYFIRLVLSLPRNNENHWWFYYNNQRSYWTSNIYPSTFVCTLVPERSFPTTKSISRSHWNLDRQRHRRRIPSIMTLYRTKNRSHCAKH